MVARLRWAGAHNKAEHNTCSYASSQHSKKTLHLTQTPRVLFRTIAYFLRFSGSSSSWDNF